MPVISRFYGISVKMYYNDHAPPHFHAAYAGNEVVVEIESFKVLRGKFPPRALSLLEEWARIHQLELRENWNLAAAAQSLRPIDPLE